MHPKNTRTCITCKHRLPKEAFDHYASGNGRRHERCRECRNKIGYFGKGRPMPPPPNPSGFCMCGCGQKTSIARTSNSTIGHVKGQHNRYIEGHGPHVTSGKMWKVDPQSGCWVWLRATNKTGRGRLSTWDGSRRKGHEAHRWIYEQRKGPIPSGMELDHLCCNPLCVNPDHLEPVTHAENHRRDRLRRQAIGRLWLEMRRGNHSGILRLDDVIVGRLVDDDGAWTIE